MWELTILSGVSVLSHSVILPLQPSATRNKQHTPTDSLAAQLFADASQTCREQHLVGRQLPRCGDVLASERGRQGVRGAQQGQRRHVDGKGSGHGSGRRRRRLGRRRLTWRIGGCSRDVHDPGITLEESV